MALPRSSRRVTLAAEPVDFRAAQLNQLRKKQHLQPAAAPPTTPAQLLSSPHSDTPSSPPTPLEFFSLARYPPYKRHPCTSYPALLSRHSTPETGVDDPPTPAPHEMQYRGMSTAGFSVRPQLMCPDFVHSCLFQTLCENQCHIGQNFKLVPLFTTSS